MPPKPPVPPRFPPPRAPAPHVQAAFARVAQAKMPARPAQAEHVRQALAVAQAKLVKVPAPPSPGVVQPTRWKFQAQPAAWKEVTGEKSAKATEFDKPALTNKMLKDGDIFDDAEGTLERQGQRVGGFSPKRLAEKSAHEDIKGAKVVEAPVKAEPKKELTRDEKANLAAKKHEEKKKLTQSAEAAMNDYLKKHPGGLGNRTLCVAYHPRAKAYVAGFSGGPNTKIWKRQDGKVVPTIEAARLAAFAARLTEVTPKTEREVWVCAEVDAAVNAILTKGWKITDLLFLCIEKPSADKPVKQIAPCNNCHQWVK